MSYIIINFNGGATQRCEIPRFIFLFMKTDYTKPILSTKEHIKLLKSRNLIINNYKFA